MIATPEVVEAERWNEQRPGNRWEDVPPATPDELAAVLKLFSTPHGPDVNPHEMLMRRSYADVPTVYQPPVIEPDVCEGEPIFYFEAGRRGSDGRPYIALCVSEPGCTMKEERYHPAVNTGLYRLLERLAANASQPANIAESGSS